MALLAVQGKTCLRVIRFSGGGVSFGVARVAIDRRAGILLSRMPPMARLAISYRVRAGEGEAFCRVKIKRAPPILPIARGMTILAVQSKLTIVVVGVTIDTTGADMAEDRLLVTTDTLGDLMRAHQVKTGRGVIELERVAHLRPRFGRVTVLAVPL